MTASKGIYDQAQRAANALVRRQARECGLVRYSTGQPCRDGHMAERFVRNGRCVKCAMASTVAWQRRNPERVKAWTDAARKRYERDKPERVLNSKRYYKVRHADRIKAAAVDYVAKNKERMAARKKAWLQRNPSAQLRWERTRSARRLHAMPAWADVAAIKMIYEEAAINTKETGVQYSVDHYYPLQGNLVCGLHIASNLRVITLAENIKKGRRMPSE